MLNIIHWKKMRFVRLRRLERLSMLYPNYFFDIYDREPFQTWASTKKEDYTGQLTLDFPIGVNPPQIPRKSLINYNNL